MSGTLERGDLHGLVCSEEDADGETRLEIRDPRVFLPGQIATAVLVAAGIGVAVRAPSGRAPTFSLIVGVLMAVGGVLVLLVVRARRARVVVGRRQLVVIEHGRALTERTAAVRAFSVVAGGTRLGSHTLMLVRDDDSLVPTSMPFASKARAEHVASRLNAALERARGGRTYRD